jgi:hypothetical protein
LGGALWSTDAVNLAAAGLDLPVALAGQPLPVAPPLLVELVDLLAGRRLAERRLV